MPEAKEDGMEIHYDEDRGYLSLNCEPDAFREFRELARTLLAQFPEIDPDKVIELQVTDVKQFVARQRASPKRGLSLAFGLAVAIILGLAAVGVVAIAGKVMRH